MLERIVAAGVALEVCPGSNVALGVYPTPAEVPLRTLVDAGARIALGADDPLLFGPRLAAQYEIARAVHGFPDADLADLARSFVEVSRAPLDLRKQPARGYRRLAGERLSRRSQDTDWSGPGRSSSAGGVTPGTFSVFVCFGMSAGGRVLRLSGRLRRPAGAARGRRGAGRRCPRRWSTLRGWCGSWSASAAASDSGGAAATGVGGRTSARPASSGNGRRTWLTSVPASSPDHSRGAAARPSASATVTVTAGCAQQAPGEGRRHQLAELTHTPRRQVVPNVAPRSASEMCVPNTLNGR